MDKRQFQDAVDAMIPLSGTGNSISDALDVVSDNGKLYYYILLFYTILLKLISQDGLSVASVCYIF